MRRRSFDARSRGSAETGPDEVVIGTDYHSHGTARRSTASYQRLCYMLGPKVCRLAAGGGSPERTRL
jgi:hypothetical protein